LRKYDSRPIEVKFNQEATMKRFTCLGVVLAFGLLTVPASAANISASATMNATPAGAMWDYTITLTNTSGPGGDNIETFWYAWLPGFDFMHDSPTSVTPPSNWTDAITHFPDIAANGYAIMFVTTTAPLAPGASLEFSFVSPDTPAQLAGNAPFVANTPVGTSVVYAGAAFQSDSADLVVASVPEPSTLSLGILGILSSLAYCGKRRSGTL
jgi:hypothetical protein